MTTQWILSDGRRLADAMHEDALQAWKHLGTVTVLDIDFKRYRALVKAGDEYIISNFDYLHGGYYCSYYTTDEVIAGKRFYDSL